VDETLYGLVNGGCPAEYISNENVQEFCYNYQYYQYLDENDNPVHYTSYQQCMNKYATEFSKDDTYVQRFNDLNV
jgi:hypothetical protein